MEWELKRKFDEMAELKRTFNETKLSFYFKSQAFSSFSSDEYDIL